MPRSKGALGALRLRLLAGSGIIALLAVLAAASALYGAGRTARGIAMATAAEQRMELYGMLSARVSDYAVVAIEASGAANLGTEERNARLASRRMIVEGAFEGIEAAIADHVAGATTRGDQNRRATQSIVLARMQAQFDTLARTIEGADMAGGAEDLRARLDGFATQFSPLMDSALVEERRLRLAAFGAIDTVRRQIVAVALGVAVLAIAAVILFNIGLVRPILRRIEETSRAARMIGGGALGTRLRIARRDELGLLFANINRMAARLDRRDAAVAADRARLNETVAARTRELREANETLERIDGDRRRFFSDISHELRTPLTVILGETEIALRAPDLSPQDSRAALSVIRTRAKRLHRRIDDMLRVARSESGRIELAQAPFDPATAARAAIEDLERTAARRGITITARLTPDLLTLGDADWTRQVIAGLIDNAIRHSASGTMVEVSCTADDAVVHIAVLDEGEGIPDDAQARVFERFARGGKGAQKPGFGVGLALARWVIEHQYGTIAVTSPAPHPSRHGPGTRITITLPLLTEGDEP